MHDDAQAVHISQPGVDLRPPESLAVRVRRGARHRANWLQLLRFGLVGGSGYAVNLAVFTVAFGVLGFHHLTAATAAFAVAVSNNFLWNRHWTFDARAGSARTQAVRFLVVSLVAFSVSLGLLEGLVAMGLPEVSAQALAVASAMPIGFLGNRLWSFAV
ncbi:MAG: GtrA family protein [Solirubrobacterales bacterium]